MRIGTKFFVMTAAFILTVTMHAQSAAWPKACGQENINFKVKTEKSQNAQTTPGAGKALIVFVEAVDGDMTDPTARFGVDGSWVGAAKGASYFTVEVAPGTHALCASWQSSAKSEKSNVGVDKITVKAGDVYFYEFKFTKTIIGAISRANGGAGGAASPAGTNSTPDMTAREGASIYTADFLKLSQDEGEQRLKKSRLSISTPKS